ncbi:MAG: hypothetical protein ACFE8U_01850, partial [Candidatus Hermodarchaeota archaeon]
ENIVDKGILRNPLIREKPNLQPRVVYDFDNDGTISSFVVKQKTKAKRTIKRKITLTSFESNFMKFLPHPTEEVQHFLNICNNAGIKDFITMKMLLLFLEKLEKYEIIELHQNKGDYSE